MNQLRNRVLLLLILFSVLSSCREKQYIIEFTKLETGSQASIRALHVVNTDIVWAAGSSGTFLLSTDGGGTWKHDTVSGASRDEFRSINAWNEYEALLFGVGNPGRAYYTNDGGESWTIVYENSAEGIFFNSLKFADKDMGIALSDPIDSCSFLIRTSDKGLNWERITNLPLLNEGEYNFAASNSCLDYKSGGIIWFITGGGDARVFRSDDNGVSWTVANTGIIKGNSSSGIFSVSFCDDETGIIVGGTYDEPSLNKDIAAYSIDGGISWTLSGTMPREYRSCVCWLGDNKRQIAFAIGKTGCDYSLDNGNTWMPGSDDTDYYTARPVKGTLGGYAAGADGLIARFVLTESRGGENVQH